MYSTKQSEISQIGEIKATLEAELNHTIQRYEDIYMKALRQDATVGNLTGMKFPSRHKLETVVDPSSRKLRQNREQCVQTPQARGSGRVRNQASDSATVPKRGVFEG